MSEKDIKCRVCQKQFSAVYNLAKHARKYHPDQVDIIIPKKTYKYQCVQCNKNFSILKNFNFHKKTHNSSDVSSSLTHTYAKCPVCKFEAPKKDLIPHFEVEHDTKCVTQTMEFTSFEEFSSWKTDMEHDTKSKYVVERGSQCTKDGTRIIKYCCHRSGKYVPHGKGLRRLKTRGSNKINGFCPARIKLIIDKNNQCKVFFVNQHLGHDDDDLGHLFLTPQERKTVANKMALKIPFAQILDDVRDSEGGAQLERIHLLNRKDLVNIERSFHLESTVVRNESDVSVERKSSDERNLFINEDSNASEVFEIVTVNEASNTQDDDKQLAREKQKLIANFTQLIESVTSMEQLDVAKKMCMSLGPTLEAMATKKELVKPITTVHSSSPSKKKIISQRGKLHSTKRKTSKTVALVNTNK